MSANRGPILMLIAALQAATACRDPLPCEDCDGDPAEADEHAEDLPPDLPCGGADLLTDNDNCGTCGNACPTVLEGTQWEAGSCEAGECGPSWTHCVDGSLSFETCEEYCAVSGRTCVPAGCSGYTALLYNASFFDGCDLDSPPDLTMSGACTEPIPWEATIEWSRQVMCCCE